MSEKLSLAHKKEKLSFSVQSLAFSPRICRRQIAALVTVLNVVTCQLSLVTVVVLAQSQTTGRIEGTVRDQNGSVIADHPD